MTNILYLFCLIFSMYISLQYIRVINWNFKFLTASFSFSLEELHLSLNDFSHVELDDELSDEPQLQHHGVKKLHFTGK